MKTKKILFIIPDLKTGGTNSSFISLYNAIKDFDIKIEVFVIDHHCSIDNMNFRKAILPKDYLLSSYKANFSEMSIIQKITALPIKLLRILEKKNILALSDYLYRRRAKQLEKRKYDTIIGFQENEPTFLASYFTSTRKITWIHGNYKSRYDSLQPNNEFNLYKKFDAIINVSNYTSDTFSSLFPSLKEKCYSLYNIIDEKVIQLKMQEFIPIEFKKETFRIISVGRISAVKRFELIPSIACKLIKKGCSFEWYIIGPEESTESIKLLKSNILNENVTDFVYVLGNKTNPYPYFRHANLLVCLSSSEACPMIFNEAKICGIPIVTTNFGSAPEFIVDGKDGYISPIEFIETKIASLILNPKEYNNLCDGIKSWENPNKNIIEKFFSII